MNINRCIRRLALLWFAGAGILFLLLFVQSILGRYGERSGEVWEWYTTVLVPVLTLIAGAFFYDRSNASTRHDTVKPMVFQITFGMSVLYLVAVMAAILMSPFSPLSPLELMALSELALGVLQGAMMAALGVFFVSKGAEVPTAVGGN